MTVNTKQQQIFGYAWIMWLLSAVFYAIDYLQHTSPSVLLLPMAKDLHLPYTTIGNIMSIYFPIYAISQIPAGFLISKYGRRFMLSTMCGLVSLGVCIAALVPSPYAILAGRILVAIGSAFAYVGALAVASEWLPEKYFALAVGLTNTIGVIGGLTGQAFLSYIIGKIGWRDSMLYIAIFGIFWALALAIFLRNKLLPIAEQASTSGYKQQLHHISQLFKDKNLWWLSLYSGIMVGTVVNAFSELYDVVFLQKTFLISSVQAASISSMMFIGIAVGGPLHGIIAKRFKSDKTWMLIMCFATIIFFSNIAISGFTKPSINIMHIMYFVTGMSVSSMLLSFDVARKLYPRDVQPIAFAFINMLIGLCGFSFQILLGTTIAFLKTHVLSANNDGYQLFFSSFWLLLIPLILSLVICAKITTQNKNI